jgi:hypothetical protein
MVVKQSKKHTNSKITKNKLISKTKNNNYKTKVILVDKDKIESFLLFTTLLNYYVLLISKKLSKVQRQNKLKELLIQLRENNKLISKNTNKTQIESMTSYLDTFFNQLFIILNSSLKSKKSSKISKIMNKQHHGGFYFKSLEEKGENPITGADLSRLLDEMQQFFYNAKYTTEGAFLQDTDTIISMLRGDVNQFKGILQYRIFPKYYNAVPPFLKWDAIYNDIIINKKWEDLPDYLLAYQTYLRSRDEYLVEKGLKPPSVLQKDLYTGFYNKISNSINDNMYAFQNYRNKYQGRFFPIAVPM